MTHMFQAALMSVVLLSIVLTILTDVALAYLIRDKVRRNHFKNRIWHPILHALYILFAVDGVFLLFDLFHQIVHSLNYETVHWWFIVAYVPRAIVTCWFLFILRLYSGAFDLETKNGA